MSWVPTTVLGTQWPHQFLPDLQPCPSTFCLHASAGVSRLSQALLFQFWQDPAAGTDPESERSLVPSWLASSGPPAHSPGLPPGPPSSDTCLPLSPPLPVLFRHSHLFTPALSLKYHSPVTERTSPNPITDCRNRTSEGVHLGEEQRQ